MNSESNDKRSARSAILSNPLTLLVAFLTGLWLIELIDTLIQGIDLETYGIHPRSVDGLWQIASAPFLHADVSHLIANSIPLLILGWMIIIRDKWHFTLVFVVAALVSGLGIWIFGGANTIHIGASGVVFGFLGYLLGRGYFERSFVSILFGFVALILYGGILIGMLPGQPGVSWLGHLFGLAGGILAAYLVSRSRRSAVPEEEALQQSVG